ncbi:bifunctional diguanylate cyclase/phosphodiesterase [Clostridium aminobutyricum]|uniref:Bifunctional diguanylate cyclase/phosphodiesterase n=1 Tax=Clostridium aminobutyricum TaxID=33953 RepID=A0A939D7M5_CLOAM|nr:bifunctional diguanylate cyclase/phosphodiesterase [Clostridium aminobutyricum]MBN7772596.1 bifunctional diguanylate cyclase/phosphodiesterase [Clostridium aminobutyricum]
MKNKYTIFLLYLCAGTILITCFIQIYDLSQYPFESHMDMGSEVYFHFRFSQTITLFLSIAGVSILFAREGINRELKLKAYTDVTGIKNKHACLEEMSILECNDNTLNIGFAIFDLNNLKKVNDFYGHEKGDELIQTFAHLLKLAADKKYFLGRFGGDEFVAIIQNCTEEIMEKYIQDVKQLADKYNKSASVLLSFASGYAISTRNHYYLMEELLKEADKKMYGNKKKMKYENMVENPQLSKILDDDRINSIGRDDLTGLLNYEAFLSVVKKVINLSLEDHDLAILCSDISNFRYINDTFGHKEGNNILRQFAQELKKQSFCLCASRIFSDNFSCLIDVSGMSTDEVTALIEKFNSHFSSIINNEYKGSRLILSSGIYFVPSKDETIDNMLNYANTARKYTKTSYQNILVYRDDIDQLEKKKASIINSFQTSLQNGEFKVYLQAKVRCSDKSICSAEALIRWQMKDGTFYYPDEFIPFLEQTGDIIDMDFYVYEQIFSYLHDRQLAQKVIIPISLNISRAHLIKPLVFLERITNLLGTYPIPTDLITFELTESTYIQDMQSAAFFIDELHKLNFKVSMDDFGSGYSSLKVLKNMPFDEIKFDKEFLLELTDENSRKILLQMMSLVKSLDKVIVCEGVENAMNVNFLEQSDCDIMQGYYYHRPVPMAELVY